MSQKEIVILGIESSCDDTSAAVLVGRQVKSNLIAGQKVHETFGGVVPELASRAHQQNILPVVDTALKQAGLTIKDVDAIAFTRGPGLMGSLVVGTSFAKSLALALNIPLLDVNHMHAHVLAHMIEDGTPCPSFPFLCLTVSGGHTQIVRVQSPLELEVIGSTIDDAAGEAFDKIAKIIGLPYPGGPFVDRLAAEGNPLAFTFSEPQIKDYDYSFSGLKTSVLYFLQKASKENPNFIEENKADLCASVQHTILNILFKKLIKAAKETGINQIAIAGGVSANKGLRNRLLETGKKEGWEVYIPSFEFCTDNAAMIAIAGKFLHENGIFADQTVSANPRLNFQR